MILQTKMMKIMMDFLINQLMSKSPTGFEKLCRRFADGGWF